MKNDYTPSENGGLAWLADKGAREALERGDIEPFGHRVREPEREREPSDYERLLQGLYEAALEVTGERVHDHRAIEALAFFLDGLKQPEAAHQLREGVRDARWPSRNRDASKSTAKLEDLECGEYGTFVVDVDPWYGGCVTGSVTRPQPPDHTTEPFTEEAIAYVREDRRTLCTTFASLAEQYRCCGQVHGTKLALGGHNINRLAAIADHLAEMEG